MSTVALRSSSSGGRSTRSRTKALAFMKKLMGAGISNVDKLLATSSFPDGESIPKLDGLKIMILDRESHLDEEGRDVCICVTYAFDADQKSYEERVLAVVANHEENLTSILETHSFVFEYNGTGDGTNSTSFPESQISLRFGSGKGGASASYETSYVADEKTELYRETEAMLHKINLVKINKMELLPKDAFLFVLNDN